MFDDQLFENLSVPRARIQSDHSGLRKPFANNGKCFARRSGAGQILELVLTRMNAQIFTLAVLYKSFGGIMVQSWYKTHWRGNDFERTMRLVTYPDQSRSQ